jgi:hypothetical protein
MPEKITVFPEFLRGLVERVNAIIDALRPVCELTGVAPIVVKRGGDSYTVEIDNEALKQVPVIQNIQTTIDNNLPNPPGSGTYVLGSVNGVVQWIQTEDC